MTMHKYLLTLLLASITLFATSQTPPDYRPRFHVSAPKNWINDPNGLIYHNGLYHLFYQHNPFANVWGHMSWGHTTSSDLLHWSHQPLAIPEFTHTDDHTKTAIFSGSVVIDKANQNGLCPTGSANCMVAVYTGNVTDGDTQLAQHQSLAVSADNGQTWTQYAKNPVLDLKSKEFRDPNVFWYAPQQKWVMATVKATEHRVAFFESKNLTEWTLLSHFGPAADTSRVWECPSLVAVPVLNSEGQPDPTNTRWVLFISAGHPQSGYLGMQYFVGDFDGKVFSLTTDNPRPMTAYPGLVVDWGKDYYAAIPVNDRPRSQPAPVMIGWLNDWTYANQLPTAPFKGAMSLPRQIALKPRAGSLQLVQQPIDGMTTLRQTKTEHKAVRLTSGSLTIAQPSTNSYELLVTIRPGTAKTVGIRLAKHGNEETVIRYTNGRIELDRRKSGQSGFSNRFASVESAPISPEQGLIRLRIFVDQSVVEVFANDGERVLTDLIFPTKPGGTIALFADGGSATFEPTTLWSLAK